MREKDQALSIEVRLRAVDNVLLGPLAATFGRYNRIAGSCSHSISVLCVRYNIAPPTIHASPKIRMAAAGCGAFPTFTNLQQAVL